MFCAVESGSVALIHDCKSLATRCVSFTSIVILRVLIRYCCCRPGVFCWLEDEAELCAAGAGILAPLDPELLVVVAPPQPATNSAKSTTMHSNKIDHLWFFIICSIDLLLISRKRRIN